MAARRISCSTLVMLRRPGFSFVKLICVQQTAQLPQQKCPQRHLIWPDHKQNIDLTRPDPTHVDAKK